MNMNYDLEKLVKSREEALKAAKTAEYAILDVLLNDPDLSRQFVRVDWAKLRYAYIGQR